MIKASEQELDEFLSYCHVRSFKKGDSLSSPGQVPKEIFFVLSGMLRVTVTDNSGMEHTIHFASENQFIADYSSFLVRQPALYRLEAIEPLEAIIIPRQAIEWGYEHMQQGQKLGRLIAEYYFIYQDNRIRNGYARTPKERYDTITEVFPNIHNRAPQHMIASYLGITPVHLSRLKKEGARKV